MAEVSLHESVLKKVKVGQPCKITVDAFPGATLSGTVDFVALLPDKGSWWANPNKRVFRALVSLSDSEDELRPGMSCSVEIVIAEIANTVYMPLQAVFQRDGETICFVGGNPRSVSLGQNNDQWVEVSEGVEPGDIVSLSPPAGFLTEGGGGRAGTSEPEEKASASESTADSREGHEATRQNG